MQITLDELFVAYRKAKNEAFFDNNLAYGMRFAQFEQNFSANIANFHALLVEGDEAPWGDPAFIGGVKSIPRRPRAQLQRNSNWHFMDADPLNQWISNEDPLNPTRMPFRDIMNPSIEMQVLSALWVLRVGSLLERELPRQTVYAYRVETHRNPPYSVNHASHRLFRLYLDQYKAWQDNGYRAMDQALYEGKRVIVYNLDIKSFFHEVHAGFLESIVRDLGSDHRDLTRLLLTAIFTWNRAFSQSDIGLPVGLTASGVIANLLLAQVDSELAGVADVYYGRYVDDITIAINDRTDLKSPEEAIEWLAENVPSIQLVEREDGRRMSLVFPNHTPLEVSDGKTSIKLLVGEAGKELLHAVMEEQAERASEQRLKPPLPADPIRLGRRALILRDSSSEQVSDLSAARSVELKRAAFAQLLRVMEQYDRDLKPDSWAKVRKNFYGLVIRNCVSPEGLFTYHKRFPWILSLMLSCSDLDELHQFLDRISSLRQVLKAEDPDASIRFWHGLRDLFYEAALGAGNAIEDGPLAALMNAFDEALGTEPRANWDDLPLLRKMILSADWARRSYAEAWIAHDVPAPDSEPPQGLVPVIIEDFRLVAGLPDYDWRPVLFPTRSISTTAITTRLPLVDLNRLPEYLSAFKGHSYTRLPLEVRETEGSDIIVVGNDGIFSRGGNLDRAVVAVASILTSNIQFASSLTPDPDTSLSRYNNLRELLTATLRMGGQVDYLAMPEMSLPRRWMEGVIDLLSPAGISLVAGLEYEVAGATVRNQCLYALASAGLPGATISFTHDKMAPAWPEVDALREVNEDLVFVSSSSKPLIVSHDGFCFSALICSDLTNLEWRSQLKGAIDALFVLEWNKDVNGFSHIVASSATDLHAFIIQANNREFGDSWIRGPYCQDHKRDILKVKGGIEDFVIAGSINFRDLRRFQAETPGVSCKEQTSPAGEATELQRRSQFKPTPIGFLISDLRSNR